MTDITNEIAELQTNIKTFVAKHDSALSVQAETTAKAIQEVTAKQDALAAELKASDEKLAQVQLDMQRKNIKTTEAKKSIGEVFVSDAGFVSSNRKHAHEVLINRKSITNVTAAGALVPVPGNIYAVQKPRVRIRDLLTEVTLAGSSTTIIRQVLTGDAGVQATQLANKALVDQGYVSENVVIETVAAHLIASRQILDDAPLLQSQINTGLMKKVDDFVDANLLYGVGGAGALKGVMTDADINTVTQAAPETALDAIRRAITECQEADFYPNAIIVSPKTMEKIELTKGSDGHYITTQAQPTIAGVQIVVSNAMQANEFLVGDFQIGAVLFNRDDITVRTSESHGNLFIQNGIVILAEERLQLGVPYPKAFCKGTLLA